MDDMYPSTLESWATQKNVAQGPHAAAEARGMSDHQRRGVVRPSLVGL